MLLTLYQNLQTSFFFNFIFAKVWRLQTILRDKHKNRKAHGYRWNLADLPNKVLDAVEECSKKNTSSIYQYHTDIPDVRHKIR